jgi:hypothetical protein
VNPTFNRASKGTPSSTDCKQARDSSSSQKHRVNFKANSAALAVKQKQQLEPGSYNHSISSKNS